VTQKLPSANDQATLLWNLSTARTGPYPDTVHIITIYLRFVIPPCFCYHKVNVGALHRPRNEVNLLESRNVSLPVVPKTCSCCHLCAVLFQGGEQLFLYVTVFDGQVTSKSEVWARIRNSSAAPNSTELNNERPSPGTTVFLPNFRPQFPGGGKSGSGNIPSDFIQPPPPLPDISRKPRPPPPPPPPPLSPEQTTLRAATTAAAKQPTSGAYQLPLVSVALLLCWYKKFYAMFQQQRLQRQ
jgi:hypothetical protein